MLILKSLNAPLKTLIQTYIPTALIVIISWFNFWLDIDSAPARVSLSITTLLTIATQANAVKLALPEVSYMKAIDFWLGTCMTFVFAGKCYIFNNILLKITFVRQRRKTPNFANSIKSLNRLELLDQNSSTKNNS